MPSPPTDSDYGRRIARRSRRKFMLGAVATAALAGCLDDSGSGDGTVDETDDREPTEPIDTPTTPEPTDDGGGGGEQSLSRAEARELLPPESLAFRYEPPLGSSFGELWAAVVGETDAAAVRAEAESGGYNEVAPQDGTVEGYLGVPVQVDTDGDEVTVFAVTDDGTSGPVATVQVPTDELTAAEARQAVPPEVLSFSYEPPEGGDLGTLTIEVTSDTDADTLVAQPQEAPGLFTDRVGNFADDETIAAGTTLEVAADPAGEEVRIFASVDGATGEVTRWQGPE
ncbi:hypothetical protein [Halorientalis pallida]|uniref:Uncharacterized protein n=1 Tax=Halorientalis pallida TaxID=2479928 RepID=A0A498KZ35_9EURY|nr:hypothetical protein [Halorientalis pallida]RXK47810.1 hypothetical protein EAF64_14260 [Halorientalis pallida]